MFQYHTERENVTWETSTIRSWLNGYDAYSGDNLLAAAFSSSEQAAIAQTLVVNDDNTGYYDDSDYVTDGGNNTTDRLFLLSLDEAFSRPYFPKGSDSRYAANTLYVADGGRLGTYMNSEEDYGTYLDNWWLRSPGSDNMRAAFIEEDGGDVASGEWVDDKSSAVRPAFNLSLSSVLFTSAVGAGGKSAGANGLAAVADYNGSDWKLTLLDSSRAFAVSNAMLGGNTVTFSYSGAQTGVNEYLSAVIMDQNGTIAYFGRILQPTSASGTASLTLPSGVTLSDTTKLYVFNEQYNGDKRTDYAQRAVSGHSRNASSALRHHHRPAGRQGGRSLQPDPRGKGQRAHHMESRKRQPACGPDPLRQYHFGHANRRGHLHLYRQGIQRRGQRFAGAEHRHCLSARGPRSRQAAARHHRPHHR